MDVNKYIGLPFVEQGRSLETGFDCWGLVRHVYKEELNVDLPEYTECYVKTTDRYAISAEINKEKKTWNEVEFKDRMPFDVVVMTRLGVPMHVGLLIGTRDVLHIEGSGNAISKCLPLYHQTIKPTILGFYRYAGLL